MAATPAVKISYLSPSKIIISGLFFSKILTNFDNPKDMEFECREVSNEIFVNYLEIVTSHAVEVSVPGKSIKWVVYEKNSGQIAGFIRLGSPTINSKPRNTFLGKPLDTLSKDVMKRFNDSTIMGFIIVPTQPFGFNYLGGKLMAAICCSSNIRRVLNKKYDTEFCLFETTSLYGNIKGGSMYDGMRPYLRYKGDTQSKFLLTLGEEIYPELKDWFTKKNDGEELIHKGASSRKLKMQTKMVNIIKSSLAKHDKTAYDLFTDKMQIATEVTTQKRFYMSEYGYSNVRNVLMGKENKLIKADNYDRFELENIIEWWKKNATKRYNNIVADGRLRKELEVWNQNTMNDIDIIR